MVVGAGSVGNRKVFEVGLYLLGRIGPAWGSPGAGPHEFGMDDLPRSAITHIARDVASVIEPVECANKCVDNKFVCEFKVWYSVANKQNAADQKQAWPFLPLTLRWSADIVSGTAHQNMKGTWSGTVSFQGATVLSMPCRGGGIETEPCPKADERRPDSRR